MLGLTTVTEQTLKGQITTILSAEKLSQYKKQKVYVNAVLSVYKHCDFDQTEMTQLKEV